MVNGNENSKNYCPFYPYQELTKVDSSGFNNVLICRCKNFKRIFIFGEGKCGAGDEFCGYSGESNGIQNIVVLGEDQVTNNGEITPATRSQLNKSLKELRPYVSRAASYLKYFPNK